MDTKLKGDLSETLVLVELLRRSLNVLKPVGDRLPYDLAVDDKGRLVRIQVRTAWLDSKNDTYYANICTAKTNRGTYRYVKSDTDNVDFFVFVVQDSNVFYVVPSAFVASLGASKIALCPHRESKCRSEEYRNKWSAIAGA